MRRRPGAFALWIAMRGRREPPSPFADLALEPQEHRVSGSFALGRVESEIVIQRQLDYLARLQERDRLLGRVGASPARRSLSHVVEKDLH